MGASITRIFGIFILPKRPIKANVNLQHLNLRRILELIKIHFYAEAALVTSGAAVL